MTVDPSRPPRRNGTGSVAAFRQHPLHPMLVPAAIGLYAASVGADAAFLRTGDPVWGRMVAWLLFGTAAAALVAMIPGVIDLMSIDRVRRMRLAWLHASGNVVFLALVGLNLGLRQPDPGGAPAWAGFGLSLAGLVLLGVSGWLGGEMTFRHGVGAPKGPEGSA